MLRVQRLDHNIITGTFCVKTCTSTGSNATECGVGQHLMGECGQVATRMCRMWEKGVLSLGNLNHAWAHLTTKVQFVWLVWSLRAALGCGSFSLPWLGWKRWARARFTWARAWYTCVSANRTQLVDLCLQLLIGYVQHDCMSISERQKW